MQKGLTLEQLAASIVDKATSAVDITAPVSALSVGGAKEVESHDRRLWLHYGNDAPSVYPNAVARAQLAEYAGIPKAYFDKCLEHEPRMVANHLNEWLETKPPGAKRLLRTYGIGGASGSELVPTTLRAFLSDSYLPIDNYAVAQAALPRLSDAGCQTVSSNITERRFYLQAVSPRITREVKVGDVVQFGVSISNSEVGDGTFRLDGFYFRLSCLNGAVGKNLLRKAHLGSKGAAAAEAEGVQYLSERSKKLLDGALLSQLDDAIAYVLSDKHADEHLEVLRAAAGFEIKKPIEAVAIVQKRFELTEGEKDSLLNNLISGGDTSLWGLSNAITKLAHDGDYDRAVELERAGAQVIDLPRSEWKEVA